MLYLSKLCVEGRMYQFDLFDLSCCQEHNYCILMLVPLYMDEFLGKVASELFLFMQSHRWQSGLPIDSQ